MTALLELDSISKRFATVEALHAVSFQVFPRKNTAILGRSGSGKSTLLRIIAGLETPDRGSVWIEGGQVTADARIVAPPHRRGIALVFQNLALWPNLTVLGNVLLGLESSGLSRSQRLERAREALTICELDDMERRRPESLSGGQQQRAALARAFAVRPRLLLLDEPFAGLDILLKKSLIDHINTSARQLDTTVILVTHDPSDAVALCISAVVVESGRVEEQGPLSELLQNPASDILKAFIGHVGPGRQPPPPPWPTRPHQ